MDVYSLGHGAYSLHVTSPCYEIYRLKAVGLKVQIIL